MTGGIDSEDGEPSRRSRSGRLLLMGALALALVATAVMVLTNSAEWLRLGVLAALWAALLGAFLAANYRKQVSEREGAIANLQSVYELELEREVAARHEHELEIEAETRRRVQGENQTDLNELRAELRALRENLERLTGGEVLVERFALRAQSTRMRSLGEAPPRTMLAGEAAPRGITATRRIVGEPPAGPSAAEPVTQLIDQHPEAPVQAPRRREPARPRTFQPNPAPPAPGDERAMPVARQDGAGVSRRSFPYDVDAAGQPPGERPPAPPVDRPGGRRRLAGEGVTVRDQPPAPEPPATVTAGGQVWRRVSHGEFPAEPTSYGSSPDSGDGIERSGYGRRRAQEPVSAPSVGSRHSRMSHETDDDAPESGGAHAAGRSVSELLAAMGNGDAPRRHRHRAT